MRSKSLELALIALLLVPGALAQKAAKSWSVSATVVDPKVHVGQPIKLTITLRNISPHTLVVIDRSELGDYLFILKDAQGRLIDYNSDTKRLLDQYNDGTVFRSAPTEVGPGQDLKASVTLSDFYPALRPGKYSVQAERSGSLQIEPSGFTRPTGLVSAPAGFEVLP
jgi:hypothetical protein